MECYQPDKIMEHGMGVDIYHKMKGLLLSFVDATLAETMSSYEESIQAIDVMWFDFPIIISYTLDLKGSLQSGEGVMSDITGLLEIASHKQVDYKPVHSIAAMHTIMWNHWELTATC